MLKIKRKPNEVFTIITPSGDNINIKILETRGYGSQITIGIDAPEEYLILREELIEDV